MAIDQTDKAVNMAMAIVAATEKFMAALEELENLEAERAAAGLTLTDFDATYAATKDLKHVGGIELNSVVNTSIPAILSFMVSGNHDDNLQKARP